MLGMKSLSLDCKFTCRLRNPPPNVSDQLYCPVFGEQQELESEKEEETRETCYREKKLHRETEWRS